MIVDEFNDKSAQEIEDLLQGKLDEQTNKINSITNVEELNALEMEIDKEQAEYDEYIRKAEYELTSKPIDFEGKTYKVSDISKKIVYYLNKNEQTFEYCLGLHGLITFWKSADLSKINYGAYDSTLRLLGQVKYKGDSEWVDILIINNYLSTAHEGYIKDRAGMLYLAEVRNRIVNRIQLCSKPNQEA